jgi:hypothetical protein
MTVGILIVSNAIPIIIEGRPGMGTNNTKEVFHSIKFVSFKNKKLKKVCLPCSITRIAKTDVGVILLFFIALQLQLQFNKTTKVRFVFTVVTLT